jgi:acyl-CoA thioesterase I
MKIVCIGNSIVNGFPLKRSQCFASLWRQASGHEIINKGENGDVTPNVYFRFESDVIAHRPAAVLILTGTNDLIYQICTPEETMGWLEKMFDLARSHSIEVILMTPLLVDVSLAEKHWLPDVNYDSVNENLRTLRRLMLEYGDRRGVRIIDAQELFSQLYNKDSVTDYLLDGLHPTVLGHEAIARFLPD